MSAPSYYCIEVGLLYRAAIRSLLDQYKFQGELDDYIENKTLVDSIFLVRNLSAHAQQFIESTVASYEAAAATKQAKQEAAREALATAVGGFCLVIMGFAVAVIVLLLIFSH